MYMYGLDLSRHYLTVATPGVREMISVRTEFNKKDAEKFEQRAGRIAYETRIPSRISADPASFACKWCDHHATCHGTTLPKISCRSCTHATAVSGDGKWHCAKWDVDITYEQQQRACRHHRFHPDMINGSPVFENDTGEVAYTLLNGTGFRDGDKPSLPHHPAIQARGEAEPTPPYLFCSGCGLIYSEGMPKDHPQCLECSGKIEEMPF
jgi:hypothetical protein